MGEALPLADQPQLLTPAARREDLFGIPRQQVQYGTSRGLIHTGRVSDPH
jgi:hypothetical protein